MVHPEDTPAANSAMVSPGRLDALALRAIVHKLRLQVVDLVFRERHSRLIIIVIYELIRCSLGQLLLVE